LNKDWIILFILDNGIHHARLNERSIWNNYVVLELKIKLVEVMATMDMKMETYKQTEEGEIGILVRELVVIRVG
jgi:hypothetical protein